MDSSQFIGLSIMLIGYWLLLSIFRNVKKEKTGCFSFFFNLIIAIIIIILGVALLLDQIDLFRYWPQFYYHVDNN